MSDSLSRFCVPFVRSARGGVVESVHFGAACEADAAGNVLAAAPASAGDAVTFMRSSAKPFQAVAALAAGVHEKFGWSDEEIALAIGSHNGEDRHVETARSLLRKSGVPEEALRCGAHPPYHAATRKREQEAGRAFTAIRNNCSGKHAAMLAFARALGAPLETYLEAGHPVQRKILVALAACAGLQEEDVALAVDGCGVPTFALPLRNAAMAFARLLDPAGLPEPLHGAAALAARAMREHPYMVAGEGRICTILMEEADPKANLLAKAGAEGYYGVAYMKEGKAVGMIVKIADGDKAERARSLAVVEALRKRGVLAGDSPRLDAVAPTRILNHAGAVVGEIALCADF